ncbi:MAG TPA: phosphopantetheine-binding protein [Solirubrobacteraceae bacterium]|nr:phosphopantetheine-binding protein [Solirubrobacteraceae bacterium]
MTGAATEARHILSSVVGDDLVASLGDDDQLFSRGVIDSLQLVEIIERFQGDLGIEVGGEDLSPENFGSIAGMARFLEQKRARGGSGPGNG